MDRLTSMLDAAEVSDANLEGAQSLVQAQLDAGTKPAAGLWVCAPGSRCSRCCATAAAMPRRSCSTQIPGADSRDDGFRDCRGVPGGLRHLAFCADPTSGRTLAERVRALIQVADPAFRAGFGAVPGNVGAIARQCPQLIALSSGHVLTSRRRCRREGLHPTPLRVIFDDLL